MKRTLTNKRHCGNPVRLILSWVGLETGQQWDLSQTFRQKISNMDDGSSVCQAASKTMPRFMRYVMKAKRVRSPNLLQRGQHVAHLCTCRLSSTISVFSGIGSQRHVVGWQHLSVSLLWDFQYILHIGIISSFLRHHWEANVGNIHFCWPVLMWADKNASRKQFVINAGIAMHWC